MPWTSSSATPAPRPRRRRLQPNPRLHRPAPGRNHHPLRHRRLGLIATTCAASTTTSSATGTRYPEEVRPPLMKKGITGIRFSILPGGQIGAMTLESPAPATSPSTRPPGTPSPAKAPSRLCPRSTTGQQFELRFGFYYNTPSPTVAPACLRMPPRQHQLPPKPKHANAAASSAACSSSPSRRHLRHRPRRHPPRLHPRLVAPVVAVPSARPPLSSSPAPPPAAKPPSPSPSPKRFNGEIVCCDSVAVYRGMEIGTAKPSLDERARVPHHCLDLLCARRALHRRRLGPPCPRSHPRHPVPRPPPHRRRRHRPLPPRAARRPLPRTAARRTPPRKLRLAPSTRRRPPSPHPHPPRPRSRRRHPRQRRPQAHPRHRGHARRPPRPQTRQWQAARDPLTGYRILRLGLDPPRAALYDRINRRAADMFDRGLVEETARSWSSATATPAALSPRSATPRRCSPARTKLTRDAAVAAAQQGHRNYAKRQLTWFRKEPDIHWLAGFGSDEEITSASNALLESHLHATAKGPSNG